MRDWLPGRAGSSAAAQARGSRARSAAQPRHPPDAAAEPEPRPPAPAGPGAPTRPDRKGACRAPTWLPGSGLRRTAALPCQGPGQRAGGRAAPPAARKLPRPPPMGALIHSQWSHLGRRLGGDSGGRGPGSAVGLAGSRRRAGGGDGHGDDGGAPAGLLLPLLLVPLGEEVVQAPRLGLGHGGGGWNRLRPVGRARPCLTRPAELGAAVGGRDQQVSAPGGRSFLPPAGGGWNRPTAAAERRVPPRAPRAGDFRSPRWWPPLDTVGERKGLWGLIERSKKKKGYSRRATQCDGGRMRRPSLTNGRPPKTLPPTSRKPRMGGLVVGGVS